MDTTVPTVTTDLSQCRSIPQTEHFFGSPQFLATARETPDDIYRALKIDPNAFGIFVKAERDTHSPFGRERNPVLTVTRGMGVFLFVEKKTEGVHNPYYRAHSSGSVHVSIPSATLRATNINFRKSGNRYDDDYTATLTVSVGGAFSVHISCRPEIAEAAFGLAFSEQGVTCLGALLDVTIPDQFYGRYEGAAFGLTLQSLMNLKEFVRQDANIHVLMRALKNRAGMTGVGVLSPSGNKKVLEQMLPFYGELLREDEPILLAAFQTLVFESKRTINGVKVAKFFNEFFAPVRDLETFKAKLQQICAAFVEYESGQSYRSYSFEELFTKLPGYAELRKTALRANSGRALNKMVTDIEAIRFDEEKYPTLAGLIHDGSIPVSTFFRKEGDEAFFLFNDNWELWEEFLQKHREAGIQLAELASKRTTYEKSVMSYMYFILYDLPDYLEKHTGKRWTCSPKIVESAHELEPGPTQPGQTTKKRSALTPIVDNEACTVVVPYACLKVPGVSTTYTYSLNYSIVRRGLSIDGNVATSDIEERLNGRDDYGIMFYTLTGSAVGRGYPTFLIIFERLSGDATRVYFHRTHPLRSKDGDRNPVNNWIRTCYNWMVGNVNLTGVKVQQGDLVFVSVDSLPVGEWSPVNSYDSHTFSAPVSFSPCTRKDAQNILGHFAIPHDVVLNHPEHRERQVPAGCYQLRQCRSWEANPKGIWTLRID